MLRPGQILGSRYQLVGVLGMGGFAVVYDGRDIRDNRQVAVKVLNPMENGGYTKVVRERFKREIEALGRLRDPHTVRMYDHGQTDDGLLYVVFEFVPGKDLAQMLAEFGKFEPDVVEHVLRQVLSSLGEAHKQGLLHRDIKPENIRIFATPNDPWSVKLLDFGIARPTEMQKGASVTATGELVGTPRYMSPEQIADLELTPASDLYSLGMVAFEMLVGRDALPGNRVADQAERLQTGYLFSAPGLERTGNLYEVIQRMTELRRQDRLQTVAQVLTTLDGSDVTRIQHINDTLPVEAPARANVTGAMRAVPAQAQGGSIDMGLVLKVAGLVLALGMLVSIVMFVRSMHERPETTTRITAPRALPTDLIKTAPEPPPALAVVEPDLAVPEEQEPVARPVDITSGCGKEPPFKGTGELRSKFDITRAPWTVYIPSNYSRDEPMPLVILAHDLMSSAIAFLDGSGFTALADEHGFVILAPSDGSDGYPWTDPETSVRVFELFDETATQLCVDRNRVFLAAQGYGGQLATTLSCQNWLAGIATNSYRNLRPVSCANPVPRLILSPTKSPSLPIDGRRDGQCSQRPRMPLDAMEDMWKRRNGCEGEPRTVFKHADSTCMTWSCETPTESCHLAGGRSWPGVAGIPILMRFPHCEGPAVDFPVAKHVWEFFAKLPPRTEEPPPEE